MPWCLNGYDVRNPALFPVDFKSVPKHEAIKLVEKGELNFCIVYDKKNCANGISVGRGVELLKEAFEQCTGKVPEVFGSMKLKSQKVPLSDHCRAK